MMVRHLAPHCSNVLYLVHQSRWWKFYSFYARLLSNILLSLAELLRLTYRPCFCGKCFHSNIQLIYKNNIINNISWQIFTSDMLIGNNFTGFEKVSVEMLLYSLSTHILIRSNSSSILTHSDVMLQNVITLKNYRLTYCFSKEIRAARGKNRLLLDTVGHCQQAYYI